MNRAPKTAGLILDSPGAARTGAETAPLAPESKEAYINRELSWLHFTRRVMALAEDSAVPLLERVKFAGITGMLYDEFAMKRIGGLRRRIERKNTRLSPDGRMPREELQLCREELKRQNKMLCRVVEKEIRPALAEAGIALKNYDQLNADERAWLEGYFRNSVQPILTPLAVDVGHPFPFISNLGLSLAVWLYRPGESHPRFIRIKVPPNRPRWVPLPNGGFIPLEQVIARHLNLLFPSGIRWDSVLLSRYPRRQGRPVGPVAAGRNGAGPRPRQHHRHGQRRAHRSQIRRHCPGRDQRRHAERTAIMAGRKPHGQSRRHHTHAQSPGAD